MNFFESQARARRHTRGLVLLFLLATLLTVAAIDVAVALVLGGRAAHGADPAAMARVVAVTSLLTLAVIALSAVFKTLQLRQGGAVVAESVGGVPVPPDTRDPKLRRLRNVVEEMAIASGVPAPQVYVLAAEAGINAFAAGFTPADAAIAVTQGALDKLSREELQGVIAHEFSHILNGDMRLNLRLMGVIFGILALHVMGRLVLQNVRVRGGGDRKGGAAAVLLIAFALMVIGWIGLFFGRLIKAAVSRSREYLADASAVQFTRQTSGIAGALQKIAGLDAGSAFTAQRARAEEISHMLFGEGLGFSGLFATHPPILERIRRIDPQFRPGQLKTAAALWNRPDYVPEETAAPVAALAAGAAAAPAHAAERVGAFGSDEHRYARAVHAAIDPPLLAAAHAPEQAPALVLALLVDPEETMRARQLALIADPALRAAVAALAGAAARLPPAQRLPLVGLAFPALRQRPREQLLQLLESVSRLSHADGQVSLFEYGLARYLRTLVADALAPARARVIGRARLGDAAAAAQTLLSALALSGHAQSVEARRAFSAGSAALPADLRLQFQDQACVPAALDDALRQLDALAPQGKELLVEALLRTAQHDGTLTVGESELLRVICAALHCPLPPLVAAPA